MIWCLHGAVGMADDWARHAEAWRGSGHEVEAVDLWGCLDGPGASFAGFARRLCDRVRKVPGEHFLVGYSMGGRLAVHALLENDAPWAGGIVVSAHPGLAGEEERMMRMARDAEWAALALTAPWEKFLEGWQSQSVLLAQESEARLPDRRALEDRRPAVARSFMEWSLGKQDDLRPRLGGLVCPTLWVSGSRDEKFSRLMDEASALAPQSRRAVLDGGHRVPWECEDEFCGLVNDVIGEWSHA